MIRFTLLVTVAAAMILCTTGIASAQAYTQTLLLTPPPGSDFPNAVGTVTEELYGPFMGSTPWTGKPYKYWLAYMGVEVSGLAPNTHYYFCGTASWTGSYMEWFLTDQNGKASFAVGGRTVKRNSFPAAYSVVAYPTYVVELSSE